MFSINKQKLLAGWLSRRGGAEENLTERRLKCSRYKCGSVEVWRKKEETSTIELKSAVSLN